MKIFDRNLSEDSLFLKYVTFVVVSALMSYYYAKLRWIMNGLHGPGALELLLDGTAYRPYQYRALVPWLVAFMGKMNLSYLESWLSIESVVDWFRVFEAVSVFFFVIVFRYYISLFLGNTTISFILPFILFYALPFNFLWPPFDTPVDFPLYFPVFRYFPKYVIPYYPYDTPSMMFFTLGLILIYKRKWIPYYLLFALATLNRETTCFLTLVYLFTAYGKDKKTTVAFHCALQFVIWVFIKYMLYQKYLGNQGVELESGIRYNLAIISDPSNYFYVFSNIGYLWIPTLLLYSKINDDFFRRSLLVLIPFLVAVFLFAKFTELRDFCELIPIVLGAFVFEVKVLFEGVGRKNSLIE